CRKSLRALARNASLQAAQQDRRPLARLCKLLAAQARAARPPFFLASARGRSLVRRCWLAALALLAKHAVHGHRKVFTLPDHDRRLALVFPQILTLPSRHRNFG